MFIRVELSKSEKLAIDSLTSLFDESITQHKLVKEYNDQYMEIDMINDDGSYTGTLEVTELFTICAINWLRDMINSSKGLIMSAYDTFKNLRGMLGIKKLIIDDKDVNVTVPVRVKVHKNGMNIVAKKYVTQDKDKEQEEKQLKEEVEKILDSMYAAPTE